MPESRFLNANDLRLHYVDWGNAQAGSTGRPVVLLHGGSASSHWWDWVAPELAKTYRVLALDFRGHGESEHSAPPYHTRDFIEDLEALIRALGLVRPAIVGHSMGGHVAYAHAALHPDSVGALVTVDSLSDLAADVLDRLRRRSRRPPRRYATLEEAVDRFRLLPFEETVREDITRAVAAHMFRKESDGAWVIKADHRSADREIFDVPSLLPSISCPTLVVRAGASTVLTPENWKKIISMIPGSHGAEVPEVGHHFILDHPAEAYERIHRFLAACENPAP